jgi:phage terminase large subunit GpA-like protein
MTKLTDLEAHLAPARKWLIPRPPLRLSEWANQNFYLSHEQSHGEEPWRSFPYQVGILDCMGSDEIEEVSFRKSARVGYTKMLLAAVGYFAAHKSRKQGIWNPTDSDSKEFVTNELEPMIRDVRAVRAAFPYFGRKNKHNTLHQKTFLGGPLYTRGGAASTAYRRLTLDVAILDEGDAFEMDLESHGSPYARAKKRVEGATFPKVIVGSTPGLRGTSLVDAREREADMRVTFRLPCPCCSERISLRWGGKNEPHGMKWTDKDPETAKQLCERCGGLFTQADYLEAWYAGRWQSDDGSYLGADGEFYDAEDKPRAPPRSIAFYLWTANSPQTSWSTIVREFFAADRAAAKGDTSGLKAFVTETLGESWEESGEAVKSDKLQARAEAYELEFVPRGGIMLTMSVDVQGDRLEYLIKAWGVDEESWQVGYGVIPGDPAKAEVWASLREVIVRPLDHETGAELRVRACAIDSGGHHTHEVYQFCRANGGLGVFAVKGHSQRDRPIIAKASTVDFNRKGEKIKRGAQVYMIGTDNAKNLIFNRLKVAQPGPGYVHFSDELPDEYYEQLTCEKRVARYVKGRVFYDWTKPAGARNEAWDLEVYATAAAHKLKFHTWKARKWAAEAARIVPKVVIPAEIATEVAKAATRPARVRKPGFVTRWRS